MVESGFGATRPSDAARELAQVFASLYTQGGANAYGLRLEGPADVADTRTVPGGIDAPTLLRSILMSTALRNAAPELFEPVGRAFRGNVDEIENADLGVVTADQMLASVAAAVTCGGAYPSSAPPPAAEHLERLCRAFVPGPDDDCLRWEPPEWWSPWFHGMGWDHTWIVCDLSTQLVDIVVATDND